MGKYEPNRTSLMFISIRVASNMKNKNNAPKAMCSAEIAVTISAKSGNVPWSSKVLVDCGTELKYVSPIGVSWVICLNAIAKT